MLLATTMAGLFHAFHVRPTTAQSIRPDGTATVPIGDADMEDAIKQARARLPEFLALARNPTPAMHTFAVKVPIPTSHGNEYIWVTPFEIKGDDIVGRVSNQPRDTKSLKEGDRLKFKTSDVADWSYRLNGKRKGNFTSRAIAKRLPRAEAERFLREMNFDPEP
jgi:uncharacterized protein YegJ (DUF2314 family)